ncbi:hypothetical protein FPV67DRAFT_1618812 [Lyophyllum atratum]|nr:hypothetical protein FPV67DRAFT_1618812 [Lyophyllum atratum]
MVFGLFSRKREPTAPQPNDEAAPSQLRTPSPSVDSASIDKQNSPSREPPRTPSPPPETPKPTDLHALIQSIPAQTLHAYTLAHLHPSNTILPDTLSHISAFFAELAPPPRIHCVRCHKAYFDIENTDRSCFVPHDDESAEVERVSSKAKGKGTLYETLWGCCGRTVEGDGDMGPPDGWCYEGKHTTDTKRARFRADSSLQDDKLTSCERLHCHEPPRPTRQTRKRARAVADDGDEDDEGEQSSTSSSIPSTTASPRSSNAAKRRRTNKHPDAPSPGPSAPDPDQMDIDAPPPPPPASPRPKPKSRARPNPSTAKSLTTPKTSSPLVLSPPFVSHSVSGSPEPPSKARVVGNMKPKPKPATSTSVKPKSSAAALRPKASTASLKPKSSTPSLKPQSSVASLRSKARASSPVKSPGRTGKTKGLGEVVDSSIDAER